MARVTKVLKEDADWIVERMGASLAPLSGHTVLVTGAYGFLGSFMLDVFAALNDRLEAGKKARIIAVDNFVSGVPDRVEHLQNRPDFLHLKADAKEPLPLKEPVHYILHMASAASPTFYRRFPLETIDVNVNGTRNLLELARTQPGVRSMIFMSTSEIYGDPASDAIPTKEDYRGLVSCTGPRACYDESKRLGETLSSIYFRNFKTPIKVIRPFNVYGPGQRLDDLRLLPDLMSAALAKKPLVLLSDGRATRAFCYLRDATWGILSVMMSDANGEAFNVGNDEEELSMKEIAMRLAAAASDPPLEVVFEKSDDPHYLSDNPQRRCPNLGKLRAALPWSPQVPLKEGLARTLRSYREG